MRAHHNAVQRQRQRIVIGLVVIVVGLFALLDNLHILDSHLVRPLWPLVFVVAGLLKLNQSRNSGAGAVVGGALVVVGVAMTLQGYGLLHFQMRDWWPVLLIGGGVYVIARAMNPRQRDATGTDDGTAGYGEDASGRPLGPPGTGGSPSGGPHGTEPTPLFATSGERRMDSSRIDTVAVMAGSTLRDDTADFQGGEVTVVMGGLEIDLRNAAMLQPEAVLNVFVLFGGLVVKVPTGWSVVSRGAPILGGLEDKTVPGMAATHRLVIDGYVIMGGVEIKN